MRKLALVLLASAIAGPALGADLQLKAPTYYTDSGWYVGVHTGAAVAQTSVTGSDLFATSLVSGKLVADGGEVGGSFGWVKGRIDQDKWWGIASTISYQNISASSNVAGTNANVASRWSATQTVEFSMTWLQQLTQVIPSISLTNVFPGYTPIAPPGLNVAAPHNFFAVGLREYGISGSFGMAGGTSWSVAPLLEMGAIWQVLNPAGKPTGGAAKAYAWVAFPGKGVTINGLFGPGNPVTAAGANMGTQYGVALDYNFGI